MRFFAPVKGPRIFALPPGIDFLGALVAGIEARLPPGDLFGPDPLALAQVEIWVNTRLADAIGFDPAAVPLPSRSQTACGQPRLDAGDERAEKVDTRRQREDARPFHRREERHRASSSSASAIPSGRPTSTQPPG